MNRCGQMLVIVLWLLGLLSLAVGGVSVRAVHELRLGGIPLNTVRHQALAQGAVQQAAALLQRDEPHVDHLDELWATGLDPDTKQQLLVEAPLGDGRFSIGVERDGAFVPGLMDEERKLNLNTVAQDVLARLIAAVGPAGVDAQAVATTIVRWRTTCQDIPVPCHGAVFDTIDELRLVPGLSPDLFAALVPNVTVYGSGLVNVNTASADVLSALGCDGTALVQQRSKTGPFQTPPPGCPGVGVTSTFFTVPVEVWIPGRANRARLQAVIDRRGCQAPAPQGQRCLVSWSAHP